jgi:putative phosphoribosyl transferase
MVGVKLKDVYFDDRRDAGRQLAEALSRQGYGRGPLVVFGIPRGGLVVADEVARTFSAPLDVVIARKLRAPYQPELGIGAIVNGDHIVLNEELVRVVGATQEYLNREIAYQREEVERRMRLYRGERPPPEVSGKTAFVIDDGIATGFTLRASLEGLRLRKPSRLVAAAPVAAPDSVEMLRSFADEIVCLSTPGYFVAVGAWYRNFDQVSDEEAIAILHRNWAMQPAPKMAMA